MSVDMDEICNIIKDQLIESKGKRFNQLLETLKKLPKTKSLSTTTLTRHLRDHLVEKNFVSINNEHKYIWSPSLQLNYTPTISHKTYKFEITLKPKLSPSTTTLTFSNNLEKPLQSFRWYFTSIEKISWEEMHPKITLEYNNKPYPLYKHHTPDFLSPPNPYHYRFRVDFPFPIYGNVPITLIFERKRIYKINEGNIDLYPEDSTEEIEFIINCPTTEYQLQVWHVNQKTGQKFPSPHVPIQNGKTITWKNTSHNLEEYYQFDWKKV